MTTVYLVEALKSLPRVLTQLNRSQPSSTFGCFDRDYWHYTTTDFPSMRKQEAVLSLAYAYAIDNKANLYAHSPLLKSFLVAALEYWERQSARGLDEWYPGEDSFVCNAFNLYAITKTYLVLDEKPSAESLKRIVSIAEKLLIAEEKRVQNQFSAVPIGLWNVYLLTGDKRFKDASREKVRLLAKLQHDDGWFLEYGGADIGYLSLAVHYLAQYYVASKDDVAKTIVEKACDFLVFFLHPDGSTGGEYGSRNTDYLIPSGFELLAKECPKELPSASMIASFVREGLQKHSLPGPAELDDRYLLYTLSTYFEAHIAAGQLHSVKLPPFAKPFTKTFTDLGITVHNSKHHYFVCNEKKGGSFQLITQREHVFDSGVVAVVDGVTLTSGVLHIPAVSRSDGMVVIKGTLSPLPDRSLSTSSLLVLRMASPLLKRSAGLRSLLKAKLRDKLITPKSSSSSEYERVILLSDSMVTVTDTVRSSTPIESFSVEQKFSTISVPSSRLFTKAQLSASAGRMYHPRTREFTFTRQYGKKREEG